jgi:hypothetical protein
MPTRARYLVQASYATPTGRMGGLSFTVFAAEMDEATRLARRRVYRNGRSKIDMRVLFRPLNWP